MKLFDIFSKYPKISMFLLGCSLTAAIATYLPRNDRIITKTEIQEKIVYKESSSKSSESQDKLNTNEKRNVVTKVIEYSDGTKETVITDKTEISEASEKKESTHEQKTIEQQSQKITKIETEVTNQRLNRVGVSAHKTLDSTEYEINYGRRLFNYVWVDAYFRPVHKVDNRNKPEAGLGLSIEF